MSARLALVALGAALALSGPAQASGEGDRVAFARLSGLPAPVERYFRHVLTDGQPVYRAASFSQLGELRTGPTSATWMDFTATQEVTAPAPGFAWVASVRVAPLVGLTVRDAYANGFGEGHVRLFGVVPLGDDVGTPELNAGALHRYLAEAVWCPTSLLPRAGLAWSAIDDRRALATLTDHGTTVSLEFRFDDADEVTVVFSPGRWGAFDGGYRLVPWEGHFRGYETRGPMRVPRFGEVGWYDHDEWQPVWRGTVERAAFTP